jgi:signal transduction histidine kinase
MLPDSLLGRLSVVMIFGVLVTQVAGGLIWAVQLRSKSEAETRTAAQHLAHSAASAIRYFMTLPPNYRPLMIQQLREMGGTRFFINANSSAVPVKSIGDSRLANLAIDVAAQTLREDLPFLPEARLAFAWPDGLPVASDGLTVNDLPDNWVQHILLTKPNSAPVLVIQMQVESGRWIYLAALMPNPYFLDSDNPLWLDRLVLQGLSLAAILLLTILVVRWTTRPLAALADAAEAFGKGETVPSLPETGSREYVKTARAFSGMRERIKRYLEDRERLFVSISHDLRTPITRLKLRTELMDDDAMRTDFHDDLDELDMMVKGALQSVKDSDIHENRTEVRLDALVLRMIRDARLAGHEIAFTPSGINVMAKPLALKRAIGNLFDNACTTARRSRSAFVPRPVPAATWWKSRSATTVRAYRKMPWARCSSPTCGWNTGAPRTAAAWVWVWASRAISCRPMAANCSAQPSGRRPDRHHHPASALTIRRERAARFICQTDQSHQNFAFK